MELEAAIRYALAGEAMLFTGAGFSYGAKSANANKPIPVGEQFSKDLLDDLFQEGIIDEKGKKGLENIPLSDISNYYIKKTSPDRLYHYLAYNFHVAEVKNYHREIANLPWRIVYTTNYDNVFQKSRTDGNEISTQTIDDNANSDNKDTTKIVHINGFIGDIGLDDFSEKLKLTDKSYSTSSFLDSSWSKLFNFDIVVSRVNIFVGYSAYDLDISRLLISGNSSNKCIFIVAPDAPEHEILKLEDYGTVYPIGVEQFGENIKKVKKTFQKSELGIYTPALQEFKAPPKKNTFHLESCIENLFLRGDLSYDAMYGSQNYLTFNKEIKNIISNIKEGKRYTFLSSGIANGKTIACHQIAKHLTSNQFKVYFLKDRKKTLPDDLKKISKENSLNLVIIDNARTHFDLLNNLHLFNYPNISFLISERTSLIDSIIASFDKNVSEKLISVHDINKMCHSQINEMSNRLLDNAYLGELASKTQDEIHGLIEKKYNSELRDILIDIIKSPIVQNRIRTSLDEARSKLSKVEEVLATKLILTSLGYEADEYELLFFHDNTQILDFRKYAKSYFQEFAIINGNEVSVPSTIMSNFILSNVMDSSVIMSQMINIAEKSGHSYDVDNFYAELWRKITRYSHIEPIFPLENKIDSLIYYYEQIKNINNATRRMHFWLQYGISVLVGNHFIRAEKCFNQAYELSKVAKKNTHLIDNHYSRLLLKRQIENREFIFSDFKKADSIIRKQIKNSDKTDYFPYRVALLYKQYLETFDSEMNDSQFDIFSKSVQHVIDSAKQSERLQQFAVVRQCIEELTNIC